jgi:hypothetical protein
MIIVININVNFVFDVKFLRIKLILYISKLETQSRTFGYLDCRQISHSRLFCLGILKLERQH